MTEAERTKHEVFSQWLVSGKMAKQPIEWEWFVRKSYLDGNHWIRWNPATKSIEQVGAGNKWKTTINEIYRITRAIRAYITKNDPKWEVMAQDLAKRVFEKATGSERLLDTYYIEEKIKMRLKEIIGDALYASVGHWWFWWNAERKWLECESVGPFDFIPDPTAKDYLEYSDAKFVARAYSKKAEDIRNDKRFSNRDDVVADNLIAASDMKTTLLQLSPGVNPNAWTDQKDLETTMCYELYYRVEEANKRGGVINHAIITPTATLIDEETRFADMPARTYHTDIETDAQYTQGWVKNLIGPQKIIDQNESSTLEYNHIFGKGRYITERGSGVTTIVNRNGQIITKNKGTYFEQLRTDAQPESVERQTNRALQHMENIGAAHDAFMGRKPTGADSGVAIEALMLGEENNLSDLRDNLVDFMVSSARFILKTFARNKMDVMTLFKQEPDKEEPDVYAVVGDNSPLKGDKKGEVEVTYNGEVKKVKLGRILEDNNVRVTIGTWIGTGKLGSQDKLTKLAEAGLVDKQTILEYYNAPNIPRIIDRLRREAAEKALLDATVTQPPGTVPAVDMASGTMGGAGVPAPVGQAGAGIPA